MEKEQINEIKQKMVSSSKAKALCFFAAYFTALKKSFVCCGRAPRMEFWSFLIGNIIINVVLSIILSILGMVFKPCLMVPFVVIYGLINLFMAIGLITVSIRRLHDLNLSGFWLWYLSSMGLPVVFIVNLLNLDNSCNSVLEKFTKYSNSWIAWILLPIFWFIGAPVVIFLLFLYVGKDEENQYGPSPYTEVK